MKRPHPILYRLYDFDREEIAADSDSRPLDLARLYLDHVRLQWEHNHARLRYELDDRFRDRQNDRKMNNKELKELDREFDREREPLDGSNEEFLSWIDREIGSVQRLLEGLADLPARVADRILAEPRARARPAANGGPQPIHNRKKFWENSVTACLRILKSRRDSAEPEREKVTVEDIAGEMQSPINPATWHRCKRTARKPDGTVGCDVEEVIQEAYRRLERINLED